MARLIALSAALCALLAAGGARAEEAAAKESEPLDEEFLEFLATLDSDDEVWASFLAAAQGDPASAADEDPAADEADEAKRRKAKPKVTGDDES